jgi:hypothetical protein
LIKQGGYTLNTINTVVSNAFYPFRHGIVNDFSFLEKRESLKEMNEMVSNHLAANTTDQNKNKSVISSGYTSAIGKLREFLVESGQLQTEI